MRVLLDTNILARAAGGPPGPAHELYLRLTRREHVLLLSSFLIGELGRVLRYDRVRPIHGFSDSEIDQFLSDLGLIGEMVDVEAVPPAIVVADPLDDPIVHATVAGKADVLCTLDRHLLQPAVSAYCGLRGVRVITDVELLALLRATTAP